MMGKEYVLGMNLDMQNGCYVAGPTDTWRNIKGWEGWMLRWKELCSDLSISLRVYSPLILVGLPHFLLWKVRVDITICILCSPITDCRTGTGL